MNDRKKVIYFIRAGNYIKIGISTECGIGGRMAAMQTGCPYKLELLVSVRGSCAVEREFHDKLHDSHFRGEWFHDTPEVEAVICELCTRKHAFGSRVEESIEEAA